jgi:glyoxylase I family protein
MTASGLTGILHAVVVTGDFERTLAFYRDVLGLVAGPVTQHDPARLRRLGGPADAVARAVILKAPDGSEIEIASFSRPRGNARSELQWQDAGIRSVTFVVEDIEATAARLGAAGYPLANEIVPFVEAGRPVRVAYFEGPDGVVLTLLQKGA